MIPDSCDCSMLTFDDLQVSSWSDFSHPVLLTSNPKRRSPTRAKNYASSNAVSGGGWRTGEFKHHEDYHAYIQDYKNSQQKASRNQKSGNFSAITTHHSTYNLHLPIYKRRLNTAVKQQLVERERNAPVDNCPETGYRIRSSIASSREDKICLGSESDFECKFYKQRDPSNISLTGKFVRRTSVSKLTSFPTQDVTPKPWPSLGQPKLPHPQNPLLTCSYKLPATFPSKVADRTRYHTAKTKSDKLLQHHQTMSQSLRNTPCSNWQTGRRLLNFDLDKPTKVAGFSCTVFKGGSGSAALSRKSSAKYSSSSRVDNSRQKQLQQLVDMLGETSLTPYLRKLTMKQTIAPPLVNNDAIDYSVIFGSKF